MTPEAQEASFRECLFFDEEVASSLKERGFAEIDQSLMEGFEQQVIKQLNDIHFALVQGETRNYVDGEMKTSPVAYMYNPERVEAELLPDNEEGLHQIFPEVLELTSKDWPLFYTNEGTVLLRPIEDPYLKVA